MKRLFLCAFIISSSLASHAMKVEDPYHAHLRSWDVNEASARYESTLSPSASSALKNLRQELEKSHKLTEIPFYVGVDQVVQFDNDKVVLFGCDRVNLRREIHNMIIQTKIAEATCYFADNTQADFDSDGQITIGKDHFWGYRTKNNTLFLINKDVIPSIVQKYQEIIDQELNK